MISLFRRDILPALVIAIVFAATAYAGIALTREASRIALLWLPNALVAAWLLRNNGGRIAGILVACIIANIVTNRIVGDGWLVACALSAANALEIGLVVWTMRRTCGSEPDMARIANHGWLIAATCAGAAASATIAMLGLSVDGAFLSFANWQRWFVADALSLLIVLPIALIAIDTFRRRQTPSKLMIREWAVMALLVTLGSIGVFAQSRYPFLFLVTPLVVYAAFRTGVTGTAAAILIATIVATVATALGSGPITLVRGGPGAMLVAFQVFLASNFAVGLPVAALLAERARDRAALKRSRDETREILDNVREIIFRADAEGRWTSLNPAWEKLTGYPVEESLGWPTTRLLHPEDFAETQSVYPRVATGEIDEIDLVQRFIDRSGDVRTIEVGIRRVEDEDGTFAGTIGNIRDVTEEKAQERALEASESRFRMIAESAPVGMFRADKQGGLTYINQWWADKVGRTVEQMLGRGWFESIADPQPLLDDPPFRNFVPGMVRRREIHFRAADGSDLWMETYNTAEFDEEGNLKGYYGAAVDITAQREMTRALAERDRLLTELADNITDAILRLAPDGTCLYASPSASDVLRRPVEELLGEKLFEGIVAEDLPAVSDAVDDILSGKRDRALVAFRAIRRSETQADRWLEANCSAIRSSNADEPAQIIASVRDITPTKTLEAELRAARQQAEAAAMAKSAFLANMSHEIRTPMNGVIGFTDLLEQSALESDQRNYVRMIAESGRTMMQLLNDILDRSKIDAGLMQVTSEPMDLPHKLHSISRLMAPLAQRKGVELTTRIDPALPRMILGDRLRVRQVLQNLVGNAVKFTSEGRIEVAAEKADNGAAYRIAVSDTGIGIAPDQLDGIFDSFTQGDTSVARRFGGSGLGLSITRQLVELMGGSIAVTSTPGKGSTFTVTLPLIASDGVESDAGDMGRSGEVSPTSGMRLLVAEDIEINQHLIEAMILRVGARCEIVADGAAAIERVEQACAQDAPFDLVLMDLQMPGMDGLSAARILRERGYDAERVPIVALTANAYEEDVRACHDAGMQGHIAKPLTVEALSKMLDRFAGRGEGASRPAQASPSASDPPDNGALDAAHPLRLKYDDRKDRLRELAHSIDQSNVTDRWADLASALHQLAGTAAVFGEGELGKRAARFEHELVKANTDQERLELILEGRSRLDVAA
ncbi:PAS domain S-box protein [Alteriqipengyuania sp.]|uniref:PAS domain S-box protein n=1 Tax=Alteriqipengyuania sp. TaxID=2800692 RepID=UPI0035184451